MDDIAYMSIVLKMRFIISILQKSQDNSRDNDMDDLVVDSRHTRVLSLMGKVRSIARNPQHPREVLMWGRFSLASDRPEVD
jgi:hypothetical protein